MLRDGRALALAMGVALAVTSLTGVAEAQRRSSPARPTPARPTPARPTPAQIAHARARFEEGAAQYEAGRLHEALEAFLDSWNTVRNPMLAYNVARTYERLGDTDNGIRFYGYYLRHAAPDAADREAVEARIRELEALRARQQDQLRMLPPSRDELAQEARTFFDRGIALYRRREYRGAHAAFSAAYNYTRPNPPGEVIYNLAMVCERLDQLGDAIDYYREYARMLPQNSPERRSVNERVAQLRQRR